MPPESTAPTGQALPAGTRLEEFEVLRVLGSGGFGITYLARDVKLGRQVVIKENLPAQFAFRDMSSLAVSPRHTSGGDSDNFAWSLENFSRESSILASLDHPGIVSVMQSFEAFGTSYFVMPHVEGDPLDVLTSRRKEDPYGEEELRGLLEHVLDALGYLHGKSIYHRDIKPSNILVTKEGVPILIDFGSARQRLSERSMTVVESAGYTPFEQLQSRGNVGPWSDLYSLGATVFKVITGEAPPKANDRMLGDPFTPLRQKAELRGRYSAGFLSSVDRALAVRVENRWQSGAEWLRAVEGEAVGEAPRKADEGAGQKPDERESAAEEKSSVEDPGGPAGVSVGAVSPGPKGKGKGMLIAVGVAALLAMVGVVLTGNDGEGEERVRLAQEEKLAAQKKATAAEAARKKATSELAAQKKAEEEEAARKKEEAELAARAKLVSKPGPDEQYSWEVATIDREGDVGWYTSLAFSLSGHPAISYSDNANGDLKYASFDGRKWTTQAIDREGRVGGSSSLSFSPSGHPAISYRDSTNEDLKYVSFDGRKWATQAIDSEGDVGGSSSLAFSPSGHPAISYYDYTNKDLKYASFDGRKWTTQTIDREGSVGWYTSLAFSPSGQPAISYYDSSNNDLKYASFDGQKWTPQTIDREGSVGDFTSLASSLSGHPAISYYDYTNDDLKYASFDGQKWTPQTIDSEGDVGRVPSLAFSPSGQPAISYRGSTNKNLKYASFDGQNWTTQAIDSEGDVGWSSSLAFSPSGHPAISYRDSTNKDLKYAHRVIVKKTEEELAAQKKAAEESKRREAVITKALELVVPGEKFTPDFFVQVDREVLSSVAEGGDPRAQYVWGRLHDSAVGLLNDDEEAVKWYRKAAEQGFADAQNSLGVAYEYGRGVEKDEVEAVKWYAKAAQNRRWTWKLGSEGTKSESTPGPLSSTPPAPPPTPLAVPEEVEPPKKRASGWETVRHNGQDYVTVRSMKTFYGFQTMKNTGRFLELENKAVKMKLTIGGQEVFMNNVKFVFSFNILVHQGRYLVSRIDLGKLVDPVLRPSFIPGKTPFNTVIIDPGHGGKDSGSVNRLGLEKNYTLAVARMLKKELEERRFKVIMTRDADRTLSLDERVKFANKFTNAIFISIHFNSGGAGGRGGAEGIETFTLSPAGVADYGRETRADDFQTRQGNAQDSANIALATAVHGTCLRKTGREDRGIRRARLSVLTGIKHPAILLEGGFMSNPYEARLIDNEAYRKTLSRSIADAVVKYRLATTRRLGR